MELSYSTTSNDATSLPTALGRSERFKSISILIAAIFSVIPFITNLKYFKRLFWFGDELHLISQMDHEGFTPWVFGVFAENFVPLFKLLWGGMLFCFNGSYFSVVCVVWATHFLNVIILGRLLNKLGFSPFAIFTSLIVFGCTWSNDVSLFWTVQWSQILSMTFLIGCCHILVDLDKTRTASILSLTLFFLFCLAGCLSFSKGVISCLALTFWCILFGAYTWKKPFQGFWYAILAIAPMMLSGLVIVFNSSGNHQSLLSGNFEELYKAFDFGLSYFFLNPLFHLFQLFVPFYDSSPHLLRLAPLKLLIWAVVLHRVWKREEYVLLRFLIFLVSLDALNAFFLGVGRYHEGIYASVSTRYQYTSLICFVPFMGIFLDTLCSFLTARLPDSFGTRQLLRVSFCLMLTVSVSYPWWTNMKEISRWSGKQGRRLIFHNKLRPDRPKEHGKWIGIPPIMTLEEVRRVTKKYNLH